MAPVMSADFFVGVNPTYTIDEDPRTLLAWPVEYGKSVQLTYDLGEKFKVCGSKNTQLGKPLCSKTSLSQNPGSCGYMRPKHCLTTVLDHSGLIFASE